MFRTLPESLQSHSLMTRRASKPSLIFPSKCSSVIHGPREFSGVDNRNKETPLDAPKCPTDLLEGPHPLAELDMWLALFILEFRRGDGDYYPPNTLQNLLAALFRVY